MTQKSTSNAEREMKIHGEMSRPDFSLTTKIFSTDEPTRIELLIHEGSIDYKSTIAALDAYIDVSTAELSPLIAASVRTIERSAQARKKLDLVGADRMYRFSRLFDLATKILGDAHSAKRWIRMPSPYFGNRSPLELLQTDIGARAVEQSLFAIGYGGVG